jgi:hypothetical protein
MIYNADETSLLVKSPMKPYMIFHKEKCKPAIHVNSVFASTVVFLGFTLNINLCKIKNIKTKKKKKY